MPDVPAYDANGSARGSASLPDDWFAERVSEAALYQSVRAFEANQRQGTASTLTRSAMSGSGAKPWRQKGTGRARAGTRKSPLWTGGGIIFGPSPRDYRQRIPKGVRRLALRSALRQKLDDGALFVVELEPFGEPRTARLARTLAAIGGGRDVLLLTTRFDRNLFLSGRNIERLTMKQFKDVTAYEVLRHSVVLLDAALLSTGEAPLPGGPQEQASTSEPEP